MRFSGFGTKATDLASAKKELYKMFPEAKSVVFLSSRPKQDTLNGWINFETAMACENFIKNLQKNPKRVITFIKTEKHDKPQRQGILHSTRSAPYLRNGRVRNIRWQGLTSILMILKVQDFASIKIFKSLTCFF